MKLSYVIQRLKNGSSLNVSRDLWDDVDFVYHINVSLQLIFSKMNSLGNWYFSNVAETKVAEGWTTQSNWELSHDIARFWQVTGWDWSVLTQANVSYDIIDPDSYEDSPWYMMSGSNKIKTKTGYSSIDVIYSRFPTWHDYSDLNIDIDLPDQLVWALEFYVFWRIMPVFFEQGTSLANNYLSQAEKSIEEYALNIGLSSGQRGFTW